MRAVMLAKLTMALSAGCAMADEKPGEGVVGDCNAAGAQALVGRSRSDAIGAEAMKRTGTTVVRWIAPGQPVTMDYRTDRLNIDIDAEGKILGFSCG